MEETPGQQAVSGRDRCAWSPGAARNAGFSLLEVMVAMTIMVIGLLVITSGFGEGGRATRSAYLYTRGIFLARQLMDQRIVDRENLKEGEEEGPFENDEMYRWRFEAKAIGHPGAKDEADRKDLLEVSVTALWSEGSRPRSLTLKTVVLAPKL